ncbi:MAG: monofunctional biosynthetic peptidoglycan transglycosylase [Acidobacteria bacterium]|nr:monofunctional biosynthetic peptidoglycan transglycosylase [Acidobacteriota bacterium]
MVKPTKRRKLWRWLLLIAVLTPIAVTAYILLTLPDVSSLRTKNPSSTAFMKSRQEEARKKGRTIAIQKEWVDFAGIPELLKEAVRITEDASFYWHKGIDFEEIKESIKRDLREKRFSRGGSTITQQLAKNLFLSPRKNPLRKVREYFIAKRLEKALSKDRIFTLYLNLIELGSGIFGVQAASRYYFGRDVSELSVEEIVRLTAIIPRPVTTDPRGSEGWLNWRCSMIQEKLRFYKKISEDEYQSLVGKFQ